MRFLSCPDVVLLRLLTEITQRHVFDHALPQQADALIGHGILLSEPRLLTPDPQTRTSRLRYRDPISLRRRLARSALPRERFRSAGRSGRGPRGKARCIGRLSGLDRPAILTCLRHREQAIASDDGEVGYRAGCVIEIDQQRHRRARRDLHHRELYLYFLRISLCFWFRYHS